MTVEEARTAVFWRNTLLLCAAIAFLGAVVLGVSPWHVIGSDRDRHAAVLLLLGACCVAMGIREFASACHGHSRVCQRSL